MNNTQNHYQTYQQQSVMTMTAGEMITALYDGMLKNLSYAKKGFAENNKELVNTSLKKVQEISAYMKATLDFSYPISENLASLYDYFTNVSLHANIKNDPTGIDEIFEMVSELKLAFMQADKNTKPK